MYAISSLWKLYMLVRKSTWTLPASLKVFLNVPGAAEKAEGAVRSFFGERARIACDAGWDGPVSLTCWCCPESSLVPENDARWVPPRCLFGTPLQGIRYKTPCMGRSPVD